MAAAHRAREAPLVGRVDELRLLRRLVGDALGGRPQLVLLTGEAGIGKSRLLREVLDGAASDGARILQGDCHEHLAIPYLPVATAFRPLDHAAAQRLALSAEATALALARDETEDHRTRVFLDATAALIDSAKEQPTLLVIEDVHWADEATTDLLRHLVLTAVHEADIAGLPLGVLLTARGDFALDAPRGLARLAREGTATEVHVDHLDVAGVHALVHGLTGARPRTDVSLALLEATDGNPLLVRSVVDRNLRSGALSIDDATVSLIDDRGMSAPTDLDDEIHHQLDKIDAPTRTLLLLAAVIGDGAPLSTLRAAAGAGADVDAALHRVAELDLLSHDAVRLHFEHPQIRHVLYEALDPTARAQLHLRVAGVLEAAEAGPGHALAVAHHLRYGDLAAGDQRLAAWTRRAGDEAWAAGAWVDALASYTSALNDGGRAALGGQELAEVLLRTGVSAYYANHDSCSDWLAEAAREAEAQGDLLRRTEALLLRSRFVLISGAGAVGVAVPTDDLEEVLPHLEGDASLRARVLATISDLHFVALDYEQAATFARRAEDALGHAAADDASAAVHVALALQDMSAMDLESARRHFDVARGVADEHQRLNADGRDGLCALALGQIDEADVALARARVGERALSSHAGQQLPSAGLAAIAILRGDVREAEALASEVSTLYAIQEYAFTPGMIHPTVIAGRLARGDHLGAAAAIRAWEASGGRGTWRYEAILRIHRGEADAVARDLRARPWGAISPRTLFTLDVPCIHVVVGVATGTQELVRAALPALRSAHDRGLVFTLGWPWCLSRLLGDGHAALGDVDAARQWYERAHRETVNDAPLEHGLVQLGQAQVDAAAGSRDDALARAADAAHGFDRMGLLFLGAQAAQTIARLGGSAPPPTLDRFILFTDIVGSTELNVRAGDERYLTLIEEHDRLLRQRFRRHDGVEHAHTGDGMSVWFSSAEEAIACAFGVRSDLERASIRHPELPLRVRIGVSVGRPVPAGAQLFGLAVVESSRVCALASADQVLVTEGVRAAAPTACSYRDAGQPVLKGLPEARRIFEAFGFPDG